MASLGPDQAEGLRKLLERPKPRILTFFSVLPELHKNLLLTNVGAALAETSNKILLIDTSASTDGLSQVVGAVSVPTLQDVVHQKRSMHDAVRMVSQGFAFANLARDCVLSPKLPEWEQLVRICDQLAGQADITLVNGGISEDESFPLPLMDTSEIIVHLSAHPAAVKNAYLLLKKLNAELGCRSFSLLVSDATQQEAITVFQNMEQAASRYLAVKLSFSGFVPQDPNLPRAGSAGRDVLEMFPKSVSSDAFRRLAQQYVAQVQQFSGADKVGIGV